MAGNNENNTPAGNNTGSAAENPAQGNMTAQAIGVPAQDSMSPPNKHGGVQDSRWATSDYTPPAITMAGKGPQANQPKSSPGQGPSNTKSQGGEKGSKSTGTAPTGQQTVPASKNTQQPKQQPATPQAANIQAGSQGTQGAATSTPASTQGTISQQGEQAEQPGTSTKKKTRRGCRAGKGKNPQNQSGGTPAGQHQKDQQTQSAGQGASSQAGQASLNRPQQTAIQGSSAQGQGGPNIKGNTPQVPSKPTASGTQQGATQSAAQPAPSQPFALIGEKGKGMGWSPHAENISVQPALRKGKRPPPQLNPRGNWNNYWSRIRITDVVTDIYAGDKLNVESFNKFVDDNTIPAADKVGNLKEIILAMDGVVCHRHTKALDFRGQAVEFHENLGKAEAQAKEYADKLAASVRHQETLQQEVDNLGRTMANLQRDLATKESHIRAAEEENTRLSQDVAASSNMQGTTSRQNFALSKEVATKAEQIGTLHREVESLSKEMGVLRATAKKGDSERQLLLEEIANNPLQRENELLKTQLGEANDELASANQNLQDLEVEVAALRSNRQVGESNPPYTTMCAELEGLEEEFVDRTPLALLEGQDDTAFGTPVSSAKGSSGPASRASLCGEFTVSAGTQTVEVEVNQASTQTVDVGASFIEASTQTVRVGDVLSSTQTEDSGVQETRDALVQTEPVTVVPGSGKWRGLIFVILMLTWAATMLWSHKEDQRMWLEANDVSRTTLIGLRDYSWEPLWLQAVRFHLAVWMQGDRVLLG